MNHTDLKPGDYSAEAPTFSEKEVTNHRKSKERGNWSMDFCIRRLEGPKHTPCENQGLDEDDESGCGYCLRYSNYKGVQS